MPLVVDRFNEIHPLLEPYLDHEFCDLSSQEIISDSIYVVGRTQFYDNRHFIRELTEKSVAKFILANPHEGSETLKRQIDTYGIVDLVKKNQILLIGGGDMDPGYPCLQFDHFLPKVFDYDENKLAVEKISDIYLEKTKPYSFLFLNGRYRYHRAWMLQYLLRENLLDRALWSNLDGANGPLNTLPRHYEVERYQDFVTIDRQSGYIKFDLFDNEWGEIYINPRPYIDTYFSVVSETVHEYPYSFRTEKIWKPVAMGHPFIVIANRGYLRDFRNLGFKTFGSVIDESYDDIEDNQERLQRVAELVEALVQTDLDDFIDQAKDICKYNQQQLVKMSVEVRREFPDRFFNFLKQHQWMT